VTRQLDALVRAGLIKVVEMSHSHQTAVAVKVGDK